MGRNFKVIAIADDKMPDITKGKVYEFLNGITKWDNGTESSYYSSYENFVERNPTLSLKEVKDNFGETINIRRKGNKTIAVLTDADGKFIRSAKARCHPDDAFDFEVGAKLAFQRLMGSGEKTINLTLDGEKIVNAMKKLGDAISSIDKIKPSYRIVKQDNYEVGDKVKLVSVRPGTWNSEGKMDKFLGKEVVITEAFNGWFKFDGCESWAFSFKNAIEGKVVEEVASQETTHSFDWQSFKSGKFAVHCDTEDKAKAFLKECDEQGIKWCTGNLTTHHTNFETYETETCYRCSNDKLSFCYESYYKRSMEIIDYTPSKPTVKEVSRVAKVGEWVKVLRLDDFTEGDCKVGDIFKAVKPRCERPQSDGAYYDEDTNNDCKYISLGDYVVLENYQPEEVAVKEVKRPAKVGEWIKIVNEQHLLRKKGREEYKNGDILKVNKVNACCSDDVYADGIDEWIYCQEYVVLENYQPKQSIDSKPEPEQPISNTSIREVKRAAKPGDFIKIVNSDGNDENEYQNGDILLVVEADSNITPMTEQGLAFYRNASWKYACQEEYVVLENFDYSAFPKNEPFRKAKVGDKIKIVRNNGQHHPEPTVGDVHEVTRLSDGPLGVWTNKGNVFWDKEQEYIIIEETKADAEPEDTEIKVGDTVKVVDFGETYDLHREYIEKYANGFVGKFKSGYLPSNGNTGIVVGKGEYKYAVLSNDKAFCISKEGIKKL